MNSRIRALREDRDLPQKALADYLQVHQTTYSDYERGNLNIPIPALIKLAEFYNTTIDYMLDLTDEPAPYPRKKK
jgi:transcriptional regulator with XRE-family HTH domain